MRRNAVSICSSCAYLYMRSKIGWRTMLGTAHNKSQRKRLSDKPCALYPAASSTALRLPITPRIAVFREEKSSLLIFISAPETDIAKDENRDREHEKRDAGKSQVIFKSHGYSNFCRMIPAF